MSKLYFRYGTMGSSKTAEALMTAYNYHEHGKKVILAKPSIDTREPGILYSRIGLKQPCISVEELVQMSDAAILENACVIVDEAQFCKKSDVEFFIHIVDDLKIPVICYGLRTDFRQNLFEGSLWLLAWADVLEELRNICWCGRKASCNARYDANGIIRDGAQVDLGANEKYTVLCRKHYAEGKIRP